MSKVKEQLKERRKALGLNDVTDSLHADIIAEMCDVAWDEAKKDHDQGC